MKHKKNVCLIAKSGLDCGSVFMIVSSLNVGLERIEQKVVFIFFFFNLPLLNIKNKLRNL